MSPTASDPNEQRPALPPNVPPPRQDFDLLVFWLENRKLIIRITAVILLGVAAWGAYLFMEYRRRAGSEQALANAKTAAEYRKAADEWEGTPAGGTSMLRLSEEQRKEGKTLEVAQTLREFLEKYKAHPMRVTAAHAVAAALETAGKNEEALAAYQQFGASYGSSSFAPLAQIGQARILINLNREEEAQKLLETVEQKYQGNPFTYDAQRLLDEVRNAAGRKTGGFPVPNQVQRRSSNFKAKLPRQTGSRVFQPSRLPD